MIKAIIFDFDGVLGDTYHINFAISKEFDVDVTEQNFIDHHMGNVFDEPKIKFQEKDIPVFFEKQKAMFTQSHLFPLEHVLEKLSKQYQLFVISSTIDANIQHFLSLSNYDRFFQKILGATTHKSKVEKFKMIFTDFKLKPEECLFISDTVGDIKESRKVNVDTIAVTWGYHNEQLLLDHHPKAIVHTPDELTAVIGKLSR